MRTNGDHGQEINTQITKANQIFAALKIIWRSLGLSTHTRVRIFKSNVSSVLLYGSECWKTSTIMERKLEVFQNKYLRHILLIFWPNIIFNEGLREGTGLITMGKGIQERC